MKKRPYSIKHTLNKNLKPIVPEGEQIKLYRVYCQLIYKRKNYLFKSVIKNYYNDLDSVTPEDREMMDTEIKRLTAIIDYEIALNGDKFDVPGFADKYEHYRRSVVEEAERLLIGKLEHIIRSKGYKYQDVLNYRYEPGKFNSLIEASEIIMPELKKDREFKKCELAEEFWKTYCETFPNKVSSGLRLPTVFEWCSGDHNLVMKNIFKYKEFKGLDLLYEYLDEFDALVKAVTIKA
jgi:hypothetical protein